MESLFQYEWLLIELIVMGILGYELWSIRRTIRRDREAKLRREAEKEEQ
jgi:hypothetical protein